MIKKSSNPNIRVMDFRGTYKGGGGPDKTILLSAKLHDPGLVYVLVTYLRDPRDSEYAMHHKALDLGINYVDVHDRRLFDIKCIMELNGLITEHNIGIIHAHDDKTLLYGWVLKLMNPTLRIMYTCHSHSCHTRENFLRAGDYLDYQIRNGIRIFLMKRFGRAILTISENTKKRLIKNGIAEENIGVMPNGIDCSFWDRKNGTPLLKEELGLEPDDIIVGTVARIAYDKDIPTFLKVAERIIHWDSRVKFVIVGDGQGDDVSLYKRIVEKKGMKAHVIFTGHRNDLIDVYASFDLFLMTSLTEGMPNTVLEAMAMGVPVVSTNVGGVPELIRHGDNGYLTSIGDEVALSEYIMQLIGDSNLRKAFSKYSQFLIRESFSFAERVKKLERYYQKLESCQQLEV